MLTYESAYTALEGLRRSSLVGWFCPRDGSLVLVYQGVGGVRIRAAESALELEALDVDGVRALLETERQECRRFTAAIENVHHAEAGAR